MRIYQQSYRVQFNVSGRSGVRWVHAPDTRAAETQVRASLDLEGVVVGEVYAEPVLWDESQPTMDFACIAHPRR